MFKDSKIAQNFKLCKTKCSYVICHDLALYFGESLVEQILTASFIVIMFDEAYNSAVRKGQMGVEVRFWNM